MSHRRRRGLHPLLLVPLVVIGLLWVGLTRLSGLAHDALRAGVDSIGTLGPPPRPPAWAPVIKPRRAWDV